MAYKKANREAKRSSAWREKYGYLQLIRRNCSFCELPCRPGPRHANHSSSLFLAIHLLLIFLHSIYQGEGVDITQMNPKWNSYELMINRCMEGDQGRPIHIYHIYVYWCCFSPYTHAHIHIVQGSQKYIYMCIFIIFSAVIMPSSCTRVNDIHT